MGDNSLRQPLAENIRNNVVSTVGVSYGTQKGMLWFHRAGVSTNAVVLSAEPTRKWSKPPDIFQNVF